MNLHNNLSSQAFTARWVLAQRYLRKNNKIRIDKNRETMTLGYPKISKLLTSDLNTPDNSRS